MIDHQDILPEGWVIAKIDEITLPIETTDPASTPQQKISYLDIGSIDNESGVVIEPKVIFGREAPSRARQIVEAGDVLFSTVRPYLRAIAQVPADIQNPVASTGFCVLRASKGILNKYLFFYSRSESFMQQIIPLQRGVSYPAVRSLDILNRSIPVAPEKEQIRIVKKLEELLSDLDQGVAELKIAQEKLTQYRQTLLKSAVEGTLTKEWREENAHKITETGEQLLARILKERRTRWEKQKLEEFASKGQTPLKNWKDKYPEPIALDTSGLPELPEEWVWASVDQLSLNKRYGSSSKTNDDKNGVPVLRMGNIQDGRIDYSNLKYLPNDHDEFPNLFLSDGDLVFNRTNSFELVGKTAIFRDIGKPCSFASYLIAVSFSDFYIPDLAAYYLNSSYGREWITSVVTQTAGQANVNGTKLGELAIPLPPMSEQLKIIELVSKLQQEHEIRSKSILEGLAHTELQRKNIIKDAFSGKLVEQNLNDEPALVLLKRIKFEREEQDKLPKQKKPKKVKEKSNFMKTLSEVLKAKGDWVDAQEAFAACGVGDGTDTDRIEELYAELRRLDKAGQLVTKRQGHYDMIKLKDI